jgi:hypothetical protein
LVELKEQLGGTEPIQAVTDLPALQQIFVAAPAPPNEESMPQIVPPQPPTGDEENDVKKDENGADGSGESPMEQ